VEDTKQSDRAEVVAASFEDSSSEQVSDSPSAEIRRASADAPEPVEENSELPPDGRQSSGTETAPALDLATVLMLVDGQNPQVRLAHERIIEAYARCERADFMWLPSIRTGLNYNKHEGAIQDVGGRVFDTSRTSAYGGMGAAAVGAGSPLVPGLYANFHVVDACFQPRIAEREVSARGFAATAVRNNQLRDASIAYWELVRAEQQEGIAQETLKHTQELAKLTEAYMRTGEGLRSDHERVAAELAVRRSDVLRVEEAARVAAADLLRRLGSDPTMFVTTAEVAIVPLELTSADIQAADLVALGLRQRPELAECRELVEQACQKLGRERLAPLIPSVILGLSYGAFGGGLGSDITHTNDRLDADMVAYWEVRNLGVGERSARSEAASQVRQEQWRNAAQLDRVAEEVTSAHARVQTRSQRIDIARQGIASAEESFRLNCERIEQAQGLPIEVLQSIQSLATARREYLSAVVDFNIAQLELWWATGWFATPELHAETSNDS
jgi:outer membrane protein TolC